MSSNDSNVGSPRRFSRPRVSLKIPQISFRDIQGSSHGSSQHSPYIMSAAMSQNPEQPAWPNPVIQQLYAQRAGDFVLKQFSGLNRFTKSGLSVGEKSVVWLYAKFRTWSRKWFTHCFLFIVVLLYSIAGSAVFMALEGPPETKFLENVRAGRIRLGELARELGTNKELLQDEAAWEGKFRSAIGDYEKLLYDAYKKGQFDNAELKQTWTFFNAMFFCGTIYTTIGYGHISPSTFEGRLFTIIYAIIGIPIFLILLTDFGKLFTRMIKFIWIFVRRLYYTGSCRKVRKTAPAQDVMRGMGMMYDFMRRPSMAFNPTLMAQMQQNRMNPTSPSFSVPPNDSSPMTPLPANLETYEVDDEFNLPISVAIVMLITYMVIGATIYWFWEGWTFFESFYFVFISISTIGFGDFVPEHPVYMMASIIYLIFGLALTSMAINVVQLKLSEHFRQASSKIIGQQLAEAASQGSAPQSPTELQSVTSTNSLDNNETPRPSKDNV